MKSYTDRHEPCIKIERNARREFTHGRAFLFIFIYGEASDEIDRRSMSTRLMPICMVVAHRAKASDEIDRRSMSTRLMPISLKQIKAAEFYIDSATDYTDITIKTSTSM